MRCISAVFNGSSPNAGSGSTTVSGTALNSQNYFDGALNAYASGTFLTSFGWTNTGNLNMSTGATITLDDLTGCDTMGKATPKTHLEVNSMEVAVIRRKIGSFSSRCLCVRRCSIERRRTVRLRYRRKYRNHDYKWYGFSDRVFVSGRLSDRVSRRGAPLWHAFEL